MISVFCLVCLNISSFFTPQEHCRFQNTSLAASFVSFFLCFAFFLCCQERLKIHLEVYMQHEISHSLGCLMSVFLARSALRKDLSSLVCKLCHFAICLCCSPSFTEKSSSLPLLANQGSRHGTALCPREMRVSVRKGSRSHPFMACV